MELRPGGDRTAPPLPLSYLPNRPGDLASWLEKGRGRGGWNLFTGRRRPTGSLVRWSASSFINKHVLPKKGQGKFTVSM